MRKDIISAENFGALMISYSEIGGHVLTPFLDTYPGSVGCRSARWGGNTWSAEDVADKDVAHEDSCR